MKSAVAAAFLMLFIACAPAADEASSEPYLPEGQWTGGLVPMNHPDHMTPLTYTVRRDGEVLAITLGDTIPTRAVRLQGDTLRFQFNEPEEGVLLDCALGRQEDGSFAGRCTDAGGQWARFTMVPPAG
jgi:hypothetical protein